jgi:hypothetical protein
MISLHECVAAVTDKTANLNTQLRELNQLRERVRKAEQARRSGQLERRKGTLIRQLAPSLNQSGNRRSVSPT